MRDYLKKYKIIINTKGPVFVGDGKEIVKKEYILNKKDETATVIHKGKFFKFLMDTGRLDRYEKYILQGNGTLQHWLNTEGISRSQIDGFTDYTYDCWDIADLNTMKNILTCIKDPYGKPYIPGSSLKGAIRTAILGADILRNRESYEEHARGLLREDFTNKRRVENRVATIENQFFNCLEINEKSDAAVNDMMRGIRISDSNPLEVSDLVLCQKIDTNVAGDEKALPILRECIKPGTDIEFQLTIDSSECEITVEQIRKDINLFLKGYNKLFLEKFPKEEVYLKDVIYLGGGAGFATKTVTHALLNGYKDKTKTKTKIISKIIDMNLPPKVRNQHKHYNDANIGVSPHTCKVTDYDGKLLQMGACGIEIQ